MSRSDTKVAEANRTAFNKHLIARDHKDAIAFWLHTNPRVGTYNSGKYYIINELNQQIFIAAFDTNYQGACTNNTL